MHGGDVYNNKVNIDFSVNINPFGVPENVKKAMVEAIDGVGDYPDISQERLKKSCSEMLGVNEEYLLFGNGSSELFMAIANTLRPKKVSIPVPSFYGYEYAFKSVSEDVLFYNLKEEDSYCLTKEFLSVLEKNIDCIILANPNNPTGALTDKDLLKEIFDTCKRKDIRVVLDECFIEFTNEKSALSLIDEYPNLIVIRSFTKIFAIPSVRIGYMICSDKTLVNDVSNHLPEWNVSGIAEAAGCECTKCGEYIIKSRDYVKKEREYLSEQFKKLGIKTYDSSTNYLLIHSEKQLYDLLLEQGILIRDCANFRGLKKGYYRIAIKTHTHNELLIDAIRHIYEK
ncbi:MAG: aminotransferase class I/II-fold pyridoxal phosphate-dependent enzyme [Lachnospiraceae bacterium]|nr:aminotransferase class I/II-fold pyridoxal phosphate-dependent enzyme [Lachnospiraceae bacterium]